MPTTTTLKRTAATIGVLASVLAAAAPANATPDVGPRGNDHSTIHIKAPGPSGEGLITYNGHAGLGSNSLA